jgi:hypothetical protein
MVNIKTHNYRLRFSEDIVFKEEPEIAFLKAIFKRLKNILCVNKQDVCRLCSYRERCLYNYMSAGDFEFIETMPIAIEKPLFSERTLKKDDILKLNFIFLGDIAIHIDFLNYTLKEFEARGLFREGYRFFIEDVTEKNVDLPDDNKIVSGIEVLTPIDRLENIFLAEKEKVDNLNRLYNITDKSISAIVESYDFDAIKFDIKNPLNIGNNRIIRHGYVGKIRFLEPIFNNNLLKILRIIGAGKFYAIGGGYIKLC